MCYLYVCLLQMFSKNVQFRNVLYKAMSMVATGEACRMLPHTRNSVAV